MIGAVIFALLQIDTLTITTVPMGPIKTVFARMSPLLPKPVFASPILAKEPLFVHVKGVSFADLRSKIALAMNGTWEEKSEGWMLTRTKAQQDADVKAFRDQLRADLALVFNRRKQWQSKLKPFDEAYVLDLAKRMQTHKELAGSLEMTDRDRAMKLHFGIRNEQPETRFVTELFSRLNPDDFAGLPLGSVTVFSPTPTPKQRMLKGDFRPLIREYVRQKRLWKSSLEGSDIYREGRNLDINFNRIQPELSRLYLEIRVEMEYLVLRVSLYDDSGQRILEEEDSDVDVRFPEDEEYRDFYVEKEEEKFKPSELSQFVADAKHRFIPAGDKTAAILKLLSEVDKFDPLELSATDTMREYAAIIRKNLVVSGDDRDFYHDGGASYKFLIEGIKRYLYKVHNEENWQVVQPMCRLRIEIQDRVALGRALKSIINKKAWILEEQINLAYSMPWYNRRGTVVSDLASVLEGIVIPNAVNYPAPLRIAGAFLNANQYRQSGEYTFPLSRLNESQRQLLDHWLYHANIDDIYVSPPDENASIEGWYRRSYLSEPTLAFPNGLPVNGSIRFTVEVTPVVCSPQSTASQKLRCYEPEEVFYELKDLSTIEVRDSPGMMRTGLRAGDLCQILIEFEPAAGVKYTGLLASVTLRPGPPFAWNKIPEDIMALVRKYREP